MTLSQPLFMENDTTDQHAIQMRQFVRDIFQNRGGVLPATGLKVSQRAAGANMSVDVAAGSIVWPGSAVAAQGFYWAYNDAVVNIAISAAHPSNPRYTSIVVKARDAFYSGSDNDGQLLAIDGTAAASPSPPDLVALGHTNFYKIADVLVAASDTSIVDGEITDTRAAAVASGGVFKYPTTGALTSPVIGDTLYTTTTPKRLWVYNGSAWVIPYALGELAAPGQRTTNTGETSGTAELNIGVDVTVDILANRRIKCEFFCGAIGCGTFNDLYQIQIKIDGTALALDTKAVSPLNFESQAFNLSNVSTPSAASHTFSATLRRAVGTSTAHVSASSTSVCQLRVIDEGPTSWA